MEERNSKTVNGKPTPLASINVEPPGLLRTAKSPLLARIASIYRRVNEVMSGMYTGVGCAGTPHSHHSYKEESKANDSQDQIKPL